MISLSGFQVENSVDIRGPGKELRNRGNFVAQLSFLSHQTVFLLNIMGSIGGNMIMRKCQN